MWESTYRHEYLGIWIIECGSLCSLFRQKLKAHSEHTCVKNVKLLCCEHCQDKIKIYMYLPRLSKVTKMIICCIFPILTVYFVQVNVFVLHYGLSRYGLMHYTSNWGRAFPGCTWRHAGETTYMFDSPGGNSLFLLWSTSF